MRIWRNRDLRAVSRGARSAAQGSQGPTQGGGVTGDGTRQPCPQVGGAGRLEPDREARQPVARALAAPDLGREPGM